MASPLRIYNPDQIIITFSGIIMSEFAESDMISIEPVSDSFTSVVGVDGTASRARNLDERAEITISLMQTSPINDLLSAVMNLDTKTPNGSGVGAFALLDNQGTTLFTSPQAWFTRWPDLEYGRAVGMREWTIQAASCEWFIGGNA